MVDLDGGSVHSGGESISEHFNIPAKGQSDGLAERDLIVSSQGRSTGEGVSEGLHPYLTVWEVGD